MSAEDVRRALERTPVPDAEAARERARAVADAAFAARAVRPRRRLPLAPALVALGAAAAIVAGLATAPGEAVGEWVRDLVRGDPAPPARPALTTLPGGGRLLVTGPGGAWVVHADGSRRRLGSYTDAAWSPHGRFVAVTRGAQLLAVQPDGTVRWALARDRPVRTPRWSEPDGYRVAYWSGAGLRVVAGDGTGDRLLQARGGPAGVSAWRPGTHLLAYASAHGRVRLTEADSGRRAWELAAPGVRALEWSPDGRRLLVTTRDALLTVDARGRVLRRIAAPRGARVLAAALAPDGRRVAVARYAAATGRTAVALAAAAGPRRRERELFAGPGRMPDLAWSPHGEWLLVGWRAADQWVFLRPGRATAAMAVARIASQFDPRAARRRAAPRVRGWCCPPS